MSFERLAGWYATQWQAAAADPDPTFLLVVLLVLITCFGGLLIFLACIKSVFAPALLGAAVGECTLLWSAKPLILTSASALELPRLPVQQGGGAPALSLATVACDAAQYGSVVSEAHGLLWPMIRARLLKDISSGNTRIKIGTIQVQVQDPSSGERARCVPLWVVYW